MNEWISVEDRLPIEGNIVPVITGHWIAYAIFSKESGFLFLSSSTIFHEMTVKGLPKLGDLITVSHWIDLKEKMYETATP